MQNDIKLSIILITYNHEKYIKQAVDSVLQQQFTCNWELIVADDASTDGTADILRQQGFDENVHLILRKKNIGENRNGGTRTANRHR